ncbi:MAG: thiamine phosphate synthase [Sporolactobacillus sp.]|jgi:thiamine-phosphate pyrophosphorylase|nr:thiamine phosphate synthase [Sporolactobacillus sp.]
MKMPDKKELARALKLYFIMGTPNAADRPPLQVLELALQSGITCFQFREKGIGALTGTKKMNFARMARRLCRQYHVPFFVDDDVELALALDADGVHVGQKDEQARTVRQQIGPERWLGVSAHSAAEAERARTDGADYIGVGPIKPTQSKADAESPLGNTLLRRLNETSFPLPMVAIGGVTPADVPDLLAAGAAGVAVISAIAGAKQVDQAVRQFLTELDKKK